jgi:hypothetical protein
MQFHNVKIVIVNSGPALLNNDPRCPRVAEAGLTVCPWTVFTAEDPDNGKTLDSVNS